MSKHPKKARQAHRVIRAAKTKPKRTSDSAALTVEQAAKITADGTYALAVELQELNERYEQLVKRYQRVSALAERNRGFMITLFAFFELLSELQEAVAAGPKPSELKWPMRSLLGNHRLVLTDVTE